MLFRSTAKFVRFFFFFSSSVVFRRTASSTRVLSCSGVRVGGFCMKFQAEMEDGCLRIGRDVKEVRR